MQTNNSFLYYLNYFLMYSVPQASPTNLFCRPMQQTIHLTWNPPGRQTINGVLIGYVVHYYKPNKYGGRKTKTGASV